MAKIININYRTEVTQLPFSKKDAYAAAQALYEADMEPAMFAQLLEFISNNSGITSYVGALDSKPKKSKKAGK